MEGRVKPGRKSRLSAALLFNDAKLSFRRLLVATLVTNSHVGLMSRPRTDALAFPGAAARSRERLRAHPQKGTSVGASQGRKEN